MTGPSATSTAFVLSLFDTGLATVRSVGRVGIAVIGLDYYGAGYSLVFSSSADYF